MSKVQFIFTLTIVIAPVLLLGGCLHSDRLGTPDVQFVNRQDEVPAGGEAEVLVEIMGAGKFKSSFYEGPIELTFEAPDYVTIEPSRLKLHMSPKKELSDRTYAECKVLLKAAVDTPPGEYEVKVNAENGKHRSQRSFYFDVTKP